MSRRVLVMRNDRLGDLVLALPALSALRKGLPGCTLGVLASPYAAPLLEGHPDADLVIESGRPDTRQKLRQAAFDAALVLWGSWSNAWLAFRAGIPHRIGPSGRPYAFLFTDRLPVRRSQGTRSEADYNQDFLAALKVEASEAAPKLSLRAGEISMARYWLKARRLLPEKGRPLVVLHPGSGGSALNWKAASYARLGQSLVRSHNAKLLVSGGPAERALMESVASAIQPKPALLSEPVPLRLFAALLSQAGLFVSGSTGPMHVAAACGTPTLSFFPPLRAMSPLRWGPLGNAHAVLTPPGLGLVDGPLNPDCMDSITLAEAQASANTLLTLRSGEAAK